MFESMCGTCVCVCGSGNTMPFDSRSRVCNVWKKVINVNAICYCHIILDVANVRIAKMAAPTVATAAAAASKPHSLCSFSRIKSCFTMKNWACSESVVVNWCMNNNKCRFVSFSVRTDSTAWCVCVLWICVWVALLCFFVAAVGAFVFISHYWPSLRWVTTAAARMRNEVISKRKRVIRGVHLS